MIKRIILPVMLQVVFSTTLIASSDFILPPNLLSVEQGVVIRQYDHYLPSTNRSASLIERETSRAELRPGEVNGDVKEEIIDYLLRFRYGLTRHWDISMGALWRSHSRESDLSVTMNASAEARELLDRLASDSVTGINHYFLEGRFRSIQNEETQLLFGGRLLFSPNSFVDKAGALAVTQGNHGIGLFTRWVDYSLSSENKFTFFFDTTLYMADSIHSAEGKTIHITRGNDTVIQMSYDVAASQGYWGFDFRVERNGDIFTDTGDSLQDFSTSYLLQFKAEWNNLLSFPEKNTVPFIVRASIGRTIAGFRTPVENRLALELLYLF